MSDLKQRRISDVAFKIDADMNVLDANRSFLRLFNTVSSSVNLRSYLSEADSANFLHFLHNFHDDMENPYFIVELTVRGTALNCIVQVSKDGDTFSVTLQELSYLLEMLDKTIFESRKYHSLLENFNSFFFIYDGTRFVMQNTADLTDMFEGDEAAFRDYFINFFMIDMADSVSSEQMESLFSDLQQKNVDKIYQVLNTDKKRVSIKTSAFSTREKTGYIALITTDKRMVQETTFSEKYDGLTNLFNKKTVTEMVTNKINVSKHAGALFIIDVDKFKECNDTFGHAFGDKVLVAVSKIIQEAVAGLGFAGRIGGDEFICFVDKTDEEDIRTIARNIRLGIQWAIPALNPESVVTSSIGVARVPTDAETYEEAFKIADKCLYIAKSRGRNCYIIYDPVKHDKVIMQNEEHVKNVLSGKEYSDSVDTELTILSVLNDASLSGEETLTQAIPMLLEFLKVHKITLYRFENGTYKRFYSSGHDDVNFREDSLTQDYFKYYNAYDFFQVDNVNVFDTLDKEKFSMYLTDKVASTLEVLCKNENKPNILVCYDVFKPAQTFPHQKIIFGIMAAKLLAKKI